MDMPPPKNPFDYSFLTYIWVFALSMFGGIVSFAKKVKAGNARAFNLNEFIGELVTSGFAGLITFWLCELGNIQPLLAAVFIAISGHMGCRVIFLAEEWLASTYRRWTGHEMPDPDKPTGDAK